MLTEKPWVIHSRIGTHRVTMRPKMTYDGPRNSMVIINGDRETVVSLPQQATITQEEARQTYELLEADRRYLQWCKESFIIPNP